jgi:hypothetical protein
MTCSVCRKKAAFRFCSNQCFLVYAKRRSGIRCAICSYDPKTGKVGDSSTNKLCADCRRAPENRDWRSLPDAIDLDLHIENRKADATLADVIEEHELPAALAEWVRELSVAQVEERVWRHDAKGHRRGSWMRLRHPTLAEIAGVVGLSESRVAALAQAAGNELARSERPLAIDVVARVG